MFCLLIFYFMMDLFLLIVPMLFITIIISIYTFKNKHLYYTQNLNAATFFS